MVMLQFCMHDYPLIPFNRPNVLGLELQYVQDVLLNTRHYSGDGPYTKLCSKFFENELGVSKALLTTSCTDALEMAAILLNIKPGDEVIFPSFTFVSTLNAFVLRGATPVFVDIRADTLNLDERLLLPAISAKTKAIVPVHYAGVGCEMDQILEIANEQSIKIVEDNAHGLFGKFKGQQLGTFGDLSTQSFHETKNISCGEGGALIINNQEYLKRAEIIREKGTNRTQFFRGEINKYGWVDLGSSFLPSDILAAVLYGQLENHEVIQEKRKKIFETYNSSLKEWAILNGFRLPYVPQHCNQAYHMFYMLAPSLEIRSKFISFMKSNGIICTFHYLPLHQSEMARRIGISELNLPNTEDVSQRLVRFPFFNSLTDEELSRVIDVTTKFS